jgi:hypothetical protein
MENIESFKHNDLVIEIYQDDYLENPREWDNLGTMVCFHNRYKLGDDHNYTPESLEEFLTENNDTLYFLPIYAYEHGNITIKTTPFNCAWDSGKVGYIYVTRANIEENDIKDPYELLRQEVKTFDHYCMGDSYGYLIKDAEGEYLESCGGFLGDISYCKDEAISMANYLDRTLPKQFNLAFA